MTIQRVNENQQFSEPTLLQTLYSAFQSAARAINRLIQFSEDLADTADAQKGAGMVGYDPALPYEAPSIGATIGRTIDAGYYGVGSDSGTDYTDAIIEALQEGVTQNKEVLLPPWTIRVDGQLPLYSGTRLIGRNGLAVLDFSDSVLASSTPFIAGAGTLGSAVLLTVAANKWTNEITAPGHGLVVGDWFRVISTVDANSAAAGEDQLGERADVVYLTETHQVCAAPSADVVQVRGVLRFSYPIGAAIKKITPLSNVLLREITVEQGSLANRLVEATLVDCMRINGLDVRNAGGEVAYRGCFNGSRIDHIKSHAAADTSTATNRQLVKITDGSTGVVLSDFDLANGGQVVDITYTPSLTATVSAPTLDTLIQRGTVRNTSQSAITDHPTCDGTVVADVTMQQVRGAVYIRSRNGTVKNVEAWGTYQLHGTTAEIGVWAGEDGYWNNLTVEGCKMHAFDTGYHMAGSGADIMRRDAVLANNLSSNCRVGENWGSVSTPDGSGCLSIGNRHLSPVDAGIRVSGNWVGLRVKDFLVRGGAPTVGAIEIAATVAGATFEGQVVDIDGQPAVTVSSGSPTNTLVDIRRFGDVGQNSGLTTAMCQSNHRQVARRTTFLNNPLTGTTSETNVLASWITLAAGEFNEGSQLVVKFRGVKAGTAGDATFRMATPGSDMLSQTFVMPSAANGAFEVTFTIDGTGDAAQRAFTSWSADGISAQDPNGPTNRTLAVAAGVTLNLSCQLGNAGDTVTMYGAEAFLATT